MRAFINGRWECGSPAHARLGRDVRDKLPRLGNLRPLRLLRDTAVLPPALGRARSNTIPKNDFITVHHLWVMKHGRHGWVNLGVLAES